VVHSTWQVDVLASISETEFEDLVSHLEAILVQIQPHVRVIPHPEHLLEHGPIPLIYAHIEAFVIWVVAYRQQYLDNFRCEIASPNGESQILRSIEH